MTDTIQQFNFSVNLLRAILWQYNDAVNLQALLQAKSDWYETNQSEFWDNWYTDVFDLRTANDFGLTVWSIILGQSLYARFVASGRETWGFGQYHYNFTRGNFAQGAGSATRITTETARILLKFRYYQLTGSGCVPEINRILKDVLGGLVTLGTVPAYVVDNHDMTITYNFNFTPTSELEFVFNYFDILPRPAGVSLTIDYP